MNEKARARLALNGGRPVRGGPFPPRRLLGEAEKAAVLEVFAAAQASGDAFGYQGEHEEAYCRDFAAALGGGFADGVNSGTAAVYVALRALEPPPFSEVVVSPVTDPGGMMPIVLMNCIPVVADAVPGGYNTGPEQVAAAITPLTAAIVVAHIGGEPADVAGIAALARQRGLPLVEDCAQAHGARLAGRPVGCFGDCAAFSTMFGKHHCTGGQGGLVYTGREDLYWRVRRAADRGKPFGLPAGTANCLASLNLNMDELAAAIGRAQLARLPGIVARRRALVAALDEGLAGRSAVYPPPVAADAAPSWWFRRLAVRPGRLACDKETFCRALAAEGIPLNPRYQGAVPHLMPWFRPGGGDSHPWNNPLYRGDRQRSFSCPNAAATLDTQFNLSIHEGWGEREVADTLAALRKVEAAFARGGTT